MMVQAQRLMKGKGMNGFIVPKPFIYASNWLETRSQILPDIVRIIDVGKVWKEVKLEQIIYVTTKAAKTKNYEISIRDKDKILPAGFIEKSVCDEFGFIVNGLSSGQVELGQKLKSAGQSLGDFVTNSRGGMFQRIIQNNGAGHRAIGGAHVQNEGLNGQKGVVPKSELLQLNAYVKIGSILVQNIVAHIENPTPRIKITACVFDEENADVVILDTVNQLSNNSEISSEYICALITSPLINWYVYRFIFAKAIRTMHFDAPVSNRIPIINPLGNRKKMKLHDELAETYRNRLSANVVQKNFVTETDQRRYERRIESLDRQIDRLVYELYELTPEEIDLVEGNA